MSTGNDYIKKMLEERTARQSDMRRDKKTEISAEDALKVAELDSLIRSLDLEKVAELRRDRMTPIERLVTDLAGDKTIRRVLRGKGKLPKRPKVHWKTKQAKIRKRRKEYYQTHEKYARKAKIVKMLKTGEGWWEYQNSLWKRGSIPVELTREEFLEVVYPSFRDDGVPYFGRYTTGDPIRLDNLIVRDTSTRKVLFDGKEYHMRKLGMIL